MTYKWQERRGGKRLGHIAQGPQSVVTEAQNLDEALDELRRRAIHAKMRAAQRKQRSKRTLKQLFNDAKLSATGKRLLEKREKKPKPPDPFAWTTVEERDAMIRRLHATRLWSARDLGRKFRLRVADILQVLK